MTVHDTLADLRAILEKLGFAPLDALPGGEDPGEGVSQLVLFLDDEPPLVPEKDAWLRVLAWRDEDGPRVVLELCTGMHGNWRQAAPAPKEIDA